MKKIATYTDTQRKEVLYFAINQSNVAKPFVLGGYTNDPNLPPIAQTGGASSFGLSELDSAVGPGGLSWRDFLSKIGCSWGIPVIEKAKQEQSTHYALETFIKRALIP